MEAYKREFIEFMVRAGVLTFGDFTTKSGRKTPFFINTGNYDTGAEIARLGHYYAEAITAETRGDVDCLFGPAYKGIPLVTVAAAALATEHDRDVTFCFNRKEVKDHGEGGSLVGHTPVDGERMLIVEDVTTAGTSIRESVPLLRSIADVAVAGVVVSVDRMERGTTEKSALAQLREEFDMHTFAIVTIDEIVEHLHGREIDGAVVIDDATKARIDAYREQYGARA